MVSYSFTGLLGTAQPTFSTNVHDLEVAWIGGLPRLFSASLPGEGAGYAEYDLSIPGAAGLVAVRGYNTSVRPLSGIDFTIIPARSGSGGTLVAAGIKPWGWASHGLTGSAGFGDPLANALAINPVAVTGATLGTANYVWFGLAGSSKILAATVSDTGAIKLTQALTAAPAGPAPDDLTTVKIGSETVLLAVSAAGNSVTSYSLAANGTPLQATQVLSVPSALGFSAPTEVAGLESNGASFAVVSSTQSSSLTVFRVLPGGILYATDHVVDTLGTRFSSATAIATLQDGARAWVAVGGTDGGVDILTLLPDGRLVHALTICDDDSMSLDHVSALALAKVGSRTQLIAASATEAGLTQIDLNLGTPGTTVWQAGGTITGTTGDDLLGAGAGTDAIYGGDGADIIVGGGEGAAAALFGGAGSDRFVISAARGTVSILDFQRGLDRLDLSFLAGLRSSDQIAFTVTATGCDLAYDGTVIHIETADGTGLTTDDFPSSAILPLLHYTPPLMADVITGGAGNDTLYVRTARDTMVLGLGGADLLTGSAGNDVLDGGLGSDTLRGGLGDDTLKGGAGADVLDGGDGNDSLEGGADNDRLVGGAGNDTLIGGDGADVLQSSEGGDFLDGGNGADSLWGGDGNDELMGGDGNDSVLGEAGDDRLSLGAGNDIGGGGSGNDTVEGDDGNDLIYGGDGNDRLYGGLGHDQLAGGPGDDDLWGGLGNDSLWGAVGSDTLHGDAGADVLDGGDSDDWLYGGDGNDVIACGFGNDHAWGDAGNDSVTGGAGDDMIDGGAGNDRLYGDAGHDWLDGGDGADLLVGDAGNDTLLGGESNDTLQGGDGDDLLQGGSGDDLLTGMPGNDTLYGEAGNDTLWGGIGHDQLYGGDGNDLLWAVYGHDLLDGGRGADTLWGGFGNDTLFGGPDGDYLNGMEGADYLSGGSGADSLVGQAGPDTLAGDGGDDTLWGGDGNDLLYGGDGRDWLHGGGSGRDTLQGGLGRDTLTGGSEADVFAFATLAEMGSAGNRDEITDFQRGIDKISLAGMGLHFTAGGNFSGEWGELIFTASGKTGTLWCDIDGDGQADFGLTLQNVVQLGPGDLLL